MANVQLPSINQGEQDLNKMVKQLLNSYIMLTEELTHLLNHLDTRNMTEIDGDILVTGTVTAGKISVQELSAISANLGHITAGLIEAVDIYGSYIATAPVGVYPRAEMSNTARMFAVESSSTNGIKMQSLGSNAVSAIRMNQGSQTANVSFPSSSTGLYVENASGKATLEFDKINLSGYTGVYVLDWTRLKSLYSNTSINDELNNLAINMTFDPTTRNLKLWSKGGNLLSQVNIP